MFRPPAAAAHGHMSMRLFMSHVHMFVAASECVTHNLIRRDGDMFTPSGTHHRPKMCPLALSLYLPVLSCFHSLSSSIISHLLINTSLVLSTQCITFPSRSWKINTDSISLFLLLPSSFLCNRVLLVLYLTFHLICFETSTRTSGVFHLLTHKKTPQFMPSAHRLRLGCGFSRACGCGAAVSLGFRSRLA